MDNQNKATNNLMPFLGIIIAGAMIAGAIVYTGQTKTPTVSPTTLEGKLTAQAKEMGLNEKKFSACLAKNDTTEIDKDKADAEKAGVQGTPGFIIGKSTESGVITGKIIAGAYPFESFKTLIEQALNDELKEGELVSADTIADPTVQQLGMTQTDFDKLSDTDKKEIYAKYKDYIANQQNASNKLVQISVDDDTFIGDKDAPVTIIDFSDFECPFCKRHSENTLPQLVKEYVDTGKVKIVYRDMIAVPGHNPVATTEAVAANCAKELGGDEAYLKMHDFIYANTKGNGQGL